MQDIVRICKDLLGPAVTTEDFESLRPRYGCKEREVTYVEDLTAEEFFERFLLPNKACLVGEKFTRDWLARQKWVSDDGQPNWPYLKENYGTVTVPVADCCHDEYGSHIKIEMTMSEYVDYWLKDVSSRGAADKEDSDSKRRILYLKDWHFCHAFKEAAVYKVADAFQSDWLNEYWDASDSGDDYRFVYMGPKGTWTPFHADVFKSYSWSTNVCGRKRWLLFPPGEEVAFRNSFGAFPLDVTSDEVNDESVFPSAKLATSPIVVIQGPGQTIFVPSGWHHQVDNLEDTISINHNWGNACNLTFLWNGLKSDLQEVEAAISDCRDMEDYHQHCQVLLQAHSGLNFYKFLQLLLTIAGPRLAKLESLLEDLSAAKASSDPRAAETEQAGLPYCCKSSSAHEFTFHHPHMVMFDLVCLQLVLADVLTRNLAECFAPAEQATLTEAVSVQQRIAQCLEAVLAYHEIDCH